MSITALAYIGIKSDKLNEWSDFACQLLGMQVVDKGGKQRSFRMDNQCQRLVVSDEKEETRAFIGWEVSQQSDLKLFANTLEKAGYRVEIGSGFLADRRLVEDLLVCFDPDGNRVELVWRPMQTEDTFLAGRPISGFVTGAVGMGHAVIHIKNIEPMLVFYRDLLGFQLSDYGLTPYPLYFFHVNGRHHSFAMVGSGESGFHHFMIEYQHLDDVGQGFDLAQLQNDRVAYTLGRHSNDYMTSYYAHSPSGFFVESGWGGRMIDPETWTAHATTDGPSFWGHERLYLPEGPRAKMRDMRLDAAARGIQAPPIHECPWLYDKLIQS
jgi:2,3-dihydroxybiphenyl 1,2-dioxygenase